MTAAEIKQFLTDLQAQSDLYGRMLAHSHAQIERLPQLEVGAEIAAMLGEKQALMTELEALEVRLSPGKAAWPQARMDLPPSVVQFADKQLAELQRSLRDLIEVEDQVSQLVEQRMLGNRARLTDLTRKSAAGKAYVGTRPVDARLLDDIK